MPHAPAAADPPRSHAPASPRASEERFELLVDSVQDYAIFMLDTTGHVLTWNRGAEKIKGWRADEIIGRSFEVFYPPEKVAEGWPRTELRRAAADGRFEDLGWRVRKDGSLMWASVVITALYDEAGTLHGFTKVTRDLTEARRQEQELRDSEEQLRLLVQSVKDHALFMIDPDGLVRTWNTGAQAILGYTAQEVIGQHFARFFVPEDVLAASPQREMAIALAQGSAQVQGWRMRKDGSLFWADVVLTPVTDADGRLRGFAKVTRDLSDQRRLSELESSSQRINEFLAMLAHELRNPLAPIRNAVGIMQRLPAPDATLVRVRDIIDRQLGHLTRLVDDLLDVGRIVTGKILLKQERLDYRAIVQASVEAVQPLVEARGHQLAVDLPPQPLPVQGDATRLTQALQNLLHNAARYTEPGGRIRLAVRAEGRYVVASVSDNGIGLAPEAMERIFDLFAQEARARPPNDSGLGIGLSLARTLTEQHGGALTATSPGPGQGSTFTLRLPLRRAADAAAAAGDGMAASMPAAPCRVLVVDDNHDSADTMAHLLQALGHPTAVAYGAAQACERADTFVPDVVLLDLNMPDGDGFGVLQYLRARAPTAHAFIAAMTGYGHTLDRERTREAGFDAHLTKPVEEGQLRAMLAEAAQRQP